MLEETKNIPTNVIVRDYKELDNLLQYTQYGIKPKVVSGYWSVRGIDIEVAGNATVHATNCDVKVYERGLVMADGITKVVAWNKSKVFAYENSVVSAFGDSKIVAYGYSQVYALDNTKVTAYDNTKITASGYSKIFIYSNECIVELKEKAIIKRY